MVRQSRRAFTMIELLVVMGILIVLVGIGVLGYKHVQRVAAIKATTTRLEMCVSMLNEFELQGSLATIEGPNVYGATGSASSTSSYVNNSTTYTASAATATPPLAYYYKAQGAPCSITLANPCGVNVNGGGLLATAGDVTQGSIWRAPNFQAAPSPPNSAWNYTALFGSSGVNPSSCPVNDGSGAVQITGMIFGQFRQLPNISDQLSKLPPSIFVTHDANPLFSAGAASGTGQVMSTDVSGAYTDNGTNPNAAGANPLYVILDGFNNPIIYVPSGGMKVRIYGTYAPATSGSTNTQYQTMTVQSVDLRPFFVSAGPDGNILYGDDNIYSCPVTLH